MIDASCEIFFMLTASLLALLYGAVTPQPPVPTAPSAMIAIENGGRHSIYNLFAQPPGTRRWGDDRLGDATIPPGRARSVSIPHRPGRCHYRLKLVLADRSIRIRRVDLCRGGRWIVTDSGDRFEPREAASAREAG
jgi:hypothetical protein